MPRTPPERCHSERQRDSPLRGGGLGGEPISAPSRAVSSEPRSFLRQDDTVTQDAALQSRAPLDILCLHGLTPYRPLWEEQQALAAARRRNEIDDLLLLLEHSHVYTNGRRGKREHLLVAEETLADLGASYVEVDRGGDITYHGPGQLVGYPIIDLARAGLGVRAYVRALEEVLVRTAAHFRVAATTLPRYPGVWIGDAKLGAIGVKVSRSVTYHGFSLNVDPDLSCFGRIVPCGLADRDVTSLAQQLDHPVAVDDVVPVCAQAFAEVFCRDLHWRV